MFIFKAGTFLMIYCDPLDSIYRSILLIKLWKLMGFLTNKQVILHITLYTDETNKLYLV